jgi:hypothetical protein
MEDQVIKYETAKLAADKGFDLRTTHEYLDLVEHKETIYGHGKYHDEVEGEELVPAKYGVLTDNPSYHKYVSQFYRAPTQSLLQKWLRKRHNTYAWVEVIFNGGTKITFGSNVFSPYIMPDQEIEEYSETDYFNSYEEALENALIMSLKFIPRKSTTLFKLIS